MKRRNATRRRYFASSESDAYPTWRDWQAEIHIALIQAGQVDFPQEGSVQTGCSLRYSFLHPVGFRHNVEYLWTGECGCGFTDICNQASKTISYFVDQVQIHESDSQFLSISVGPKPRVQKLPGGPVRSSSISGEVPCIPIRWCPTLSTLVPIDFVHSECLVTEQRLFRV